MSVDEGKIREIVRRVLQQAMGEGPQINPSRDKGTRSSAPSRSLITETDLQEVPVGEVLEVRPDAIITPLARQTAMERKIKIVTQKGALEPKNSHPSQTEVTGQKVVALGADHGGFPLKQELKVYLGELGYAVMDCGTDSPDSVDYPDFAYAVARLVSDGKVWRGIVVDGAGIGSCMAANKVPGVRAAMCYDVSTAANSREHNSANVLTLGGSLIGSNLARQIVKTWLTTEFGGGRHGRRVDKIMDIEKRFLRR